MRLIIQRFMFVAKLTAHEQPLTLTPPDKATSTSPRQSQAPAADSEFNSGSLPVRPHPERPATEVTLPVAPSFHVEAVMSNATAEYRTRALDGADSSSFQQLESHLDDGFLDFNNLTEEPYVDMDAQWQPHSTPKRCHASSSMICPDVFNFISESAPPLFRIAWPY